MSLIMILETEPCARVDNGMLRFEEKKKDIWKQAIHREMVDYWINSVRYESLPLLACCFTKLFA